jgi:putative oxidoreductase
MFKKQVMLECVSALLILLFLYASLSKFMDFTTFIGEMRNQPLPKSWIPFLVWFIPCTEIILSVLLIVERTRLLGLYGSVVLMGLFTAYAMLILLHFFPRVPCTCGGIIKKLTWPQHLAMNLIFVALSISGVIIQRRKYFNLIIINKTKNSLV